MRFEESITTYPVEIPSVVETCRRHFLNEDPRARSVWSAVDPQRIEMEALLFRLLWSSFQTLQVTEEHRGHLYERWVAKSQSLLKANPFLKKNTEPLKTLWNEWDYAKVPWMRDSSHKAQVVLVETCLRALPNLFTGKKKATDVLFPEGSMALVEGIHRGNIVSDYFNDIVGETVVAYFKERLARSQSGASKHNALRILEIGAGTGGTTTPVLEKLRPFASHIEEYCFTDLSKAFLIPAERRYRNEHPYFITRLFDVSEPLAHQEISPGRYDLVIATNVLHATPNIRQSLRNAKAALRNRGLLVLNELSADTLFAHLTFGLLEGWWLYEDPALRISGCPGLFPETWSSVLQNEGFASVGFPAEFALNLGQQIIVAESNGIVRQKTVVPGSTPVASTGVIPTAESTEAISFSENLSEQQLRSRCQEHLTQVIASTLKMSSDEIDTGESLETYGLDSIIVGQLTSAMRKSFGKIENTLLFEVQTIDGLTEHLLETQLDTVKQVVGNNGAAVAAPKSGNRHQMPREFRQLENRRSPENQPPLESKSASQLKSKSASRLEWEAQAPKSAQALKPAEAGQDIAIVGLSGRYPQADDLEAFWENLVNGIDCITEVPRDRWDHHRYFDADRSEPGKTYCKWGGFLNGVDRFDPLFFNIAPRDADLIDPKERLFLETVWELLEGSGYTREGLQTRYQGKVGVFAGAMYNQYQAWDAGIAKESTIALSSFSSIANRVSYFFNLHGPSVAVDTMCSSSMVALHMACESLKKSECQMAIAGGVNLSIHPKKFVGLSQAQLVGSHLDSRSFGEGDGYLPAEGVGTVLLKPLALAIQEGDAILAVIKSTAINHGGHTHGFSVPNPNAQAQLIEDNLTQSGIDPRTISYVESAANGSAVGDTIEVRALTKAFGQFTSDQQFCAIGSVKSNIGHAEAASGMSQLTKVILQLQHRQLVPSIGAEPLNPELNFAETPFCLQRELQEWEAPVISREGTRQTVPRRAIVNSFGGGGSNAHVIVEEYVPAIVSPQRTKELDAYPIVLSAKNQDRLQVVVHNLLHYVQNTSDVVLVDLAYTLQVGREAMETRLGFVVSSLQELQDHLSRFLEPLPEDAAPSQDVPKVSPFFEGRVKRRQNTPPPRSFEAETTPTQLLEWWVKGETIAWGWLYGSVSPRIVRLPTYPFDRERYWVAEPQESRESLHPLLNQHTSTSTESRFFTTFGGNEFFLRDHGRSLPGVTYLEMARAAGEIRTEQGILGLKNIVWNKPITVNGQDQEVHIVLHPASDGFNYRIGTSEALWDTGWNAIHSQGKLIAGVRPPSDRPRELDIEAIRSRCLSIKETDECNHLLQHTNGPSLFSIEAFQYNAREAIAALQLPPAIELENHNYTLHPSMMNGAVLTSVILSLMQDPVYRLPVPFTLEALWIYGKSPEQAYAYARQSPDGNGAGNGSGNGSGNGAGNGSQPGNVTKPRHIPKKYDIDLIDTHGNIVIAFKGFTAIDKRN